MTNGRSPLKSPPLRNPGESLHDQRDTLINDKFFGFLFFTAGFILAAVMNWIFYLRGQIPHPAFISVLAAISIGITVYQCFPIVRQVKIFNRGIDAEKSVGQYLEQSRADGYEVFHDVPGRNGDKKFNIDHVLVGPAGIFTVETKYRTKPEKGQCVIAYDGQQVSINGQPPDRAPIIQAQANAKELNGLLLKSTGKSFFVKPMVVFPGWFVERSVSNPSVSVLNEKVIGPFIRRCTSRLSREDIHLVADRLTRYIQDFPR